MQYRLAFQLFLLKEVQKGANLSRTGKAAENGESM
jgi:hypothetical protein